MRSIFAITFVFLVSSWILPSSAVAGPACSGNYLLEKTFPSGAKWQLCWEHRQREGIVYHELFYTPPAGTERKILNQANIAQIHVPYDDNGARYHDVSDYGLGGTYLNDLQTGDCPSGELRSENGKNMICMITRRRNHAHASHVDNVNHHHIGQYFEIFSVSHVGAYNYIPTWRLYDDGTLEAIMGATGSLQRYRTGSQYQGNGWLLNSTDRYGVSHLHNYYWRLDFDLGSDATNDIVEEIEFINQAGNLSRIKTITPFTTEVERSVAPDKYRSWRIRDGSNSNALGHTISYQIEPILSGHRDQGPSYEPWTHNDFYVTVNNSCEKYASHNPTLNGCTDNLSTFVNGQSLSGADIVVWYGLSFHHIPRDEDEPKMHAHWNSFKIIPRNVTVKNPLADISNNVNTPPVLDNPGEQSSNIDETINLTLTASDIDADTLSYSATSLPDGLSISTNGIISGAATTAGEFNVTLTVTDGLATDQKVILWTINSITAGGCSTYNSNDIPVAITSSGTVTVTSDLTITQGGTITDVNVLNLKGLHTYMSDLDFKLTSPAGSTVEIINNSCGSRNNFDLNLDDAATDGWPCPPVGAGTYKPANPLTVFNGEQSTGTWVLTIYDRYNLDGGSLDQWSLEICTDAPTPTNQPPVLTTPGSQGSTVGDIISLTIVASDPDTDALTFSANGLPSGLQINSNNGIISGTLLADSAGSHVVTVSVDDGHGHIPSVSFGWQIDTPNQPPILSNPGNQTNTDGDTVSLTLSATDSDGDSLIYSAANLPAGLQLNSTSGLISGTLNTSSIGSHSVTATVDDGQGHTVNVNFNWLVNAANQPPVLTNPGNQTNTDGDTVSLTLVATDPDGDSLSYGALNLPASLQINNATGLISGTLNASSIGSHSITVTVDDGQGHTVNVNFNWLVNATNQPPVLTNPGSQTNTDGNAVSLALSATDPDSDSLSYSALNLPTGLQINNTTGLISGTLNASSVGSHSVTATVDDGQGHTVNVNFNWLINAANQPPVLVTPNDQTNIVNSVISLPISASDSNNDNLSYSATGLPSGLSINTATGVISGTADTIGSFNVTITVSDGLASENGSFVWVINDEIIPPVNDNELLNGVAKTNLSAAQGNEKIYIVNPGAGQTLQINMSGGSGDADIYVRYGNEPTTSEYDCRPYLNGNDETCTVHLTQSGTYYVMVRAYNSYSGLSIQATFQDAPTSENELQNGVTITDLSANRGETLLFSVNPGAGQNLQLTISGGSGDADIYVRYGSEPTVSQYDCRPYRNGNNETCTVNSTQSGTYYVMIRAYSSFSGLNLTASY